MHPTWHNGSMPWSEKKVLNSCCGITGAIMFGMMASQLSGRFAYLQKEWHIYQRTVTKTRNWTTKQRIIAIDEEVLLKMMIENDYKSLIYSEPIRFCVCCLWKVDDLKLCFWLYFYLMYYVITKLVYVKTKIYIKFAIDLSLITQAL